VQFPQNATVTPKSGSRPRPEAPWTVSQALADLSFLLGRRIPQPT
jgi:hypothetical protein